jgi:hypothetical protein
MKIHDPTRWAPGSASRPEPPSRSDANSRPFTEPKANGRTTIAVSHERLPDADAGERLKTRWREWLSALKTVLEAP